METRIGIAKSQLFTTKNLLVVAVIVSAVTGGNLWLHRNDPALGYARYAGFGFTMDYSLDKQLQVSGFGGWEPTESGGTVQAAYQGNHLEQYGVIWATTESMPTHLRSLGGSLDHTFGLVAMDGTTIADRGAYEYTSYKGHEMVYQTFSVVEQEIGIPGIMGAWYCEEAGKYLQFYAIYLADLETFTADPQEVEQRWLEYIDMVECH
jgi:hypothetical protein